MYSTGSYKYTATNTATTQNTSQNGQKLMYYQYYEMDTSKFQQSSFNDSEQFMYKNAATALVVSAPISSGRPPAKEAVGVVTNLICFVTKSKPIIAKTNFFTTCRWYVKHTCKDLDCAV